MCINFFIDDLLNQIPSTSTYKGRLRKKVVSSKLLSNSSESSSFASGSSKSFKVYGRGYRNKKKRGKISIFTEELVAVLDHCKISYRKSVRIICAVAKALNINTDELILNKTSFNNIRSSIREKLAKNIKRVFEEKDLTALVVHWDGKSISDKTTRERKERLPILVSNGNVDKLLESTPLANTKGITQAQAVYDALICWGLSEKVKALCCDTTASNLGCHKGAATLLEKMLDTDLLYFACRHHMLELILKGVFFLKFPHTTGPKVEMFKRFRDKTWSTLDLSKYKNGLEDIQIHNTLSEQVDNLDSWIKNLLKHDMIRDDYKELLLLSRIFLGKIDPNEVKFYKPGAEHHARFMGKAIYVLKFYLFRDSLNLSHADRESFLDISLFIVFVYIKFWYTALFALSAPNNDLMLIKTLCKYEDVNKQISEVALSKLKNHLWYLCPETSVLSLFDSQVSEETKKKMVEKLIIKDASLVQFDEGSDICEILYDSNINEDTHFSDNNILNLNNQEQLNNTSESEYSDSGEDSEEENEETIEFSIKQYFCNTLEDIKALKNKEMDYFINSESYNFFKRFSIEPSFLKEDIKTWGKNKDYQNALNQLKNLHVVNDLAERNVKATEDYLSENLLCKTEDQKQYLLQVTEAAKKKYPKSTKTCLTGKNTNQKYKKRKLN